MDNNPLFISGFIELYRRCPCLWKVKDGNYSNKRSKGEAYGLLLNFYKKKTVASATVDTVKKKINNLRSAFRKELKKVKTSKSGSSADDSYTPSLWYYKLLLFAADQEDQRMTVDPDYNEPLFDTQEETPSDHSSDSNQMSPSPSPVDWSAVPSTSPVPSTSCVPSTSYVPSNPSFSADLTPPAKSSRSRKSRNEERKRTYDAAVKGLKEEDEFGGIGINVSCKLRRMDVDQRMHAEMLLSKLLLYGIKGMLQEETDFQHLLRAVPARRREDQSSKSDPPAEENNSV